MIVTNFEIDYGEKIGVTKVTVYDPCDTPEKKQKRRDEVNRVARFLLHLPPEEK